MFSYLIFNELAETFDLGLEVCDQFLIVSGWSALPMKCIAEQRHMQCKYKVIETAVLHEAATPKWLVYKVINIHLLGNYQSMKT